MITITSVCTHNNLTGGEDKYSARITKRHRKSLDDLSEMISLQTTFSKADVKGVLEALVENIPDLLLDNYSIDLGKLGIIRLYAKGESVDTPEKVTPRIITSLKVNFLPSKTFKHKLKGAKFRTLK